MGEKTSPFYFFITAFWIVFLTNAINLCDGLDGLASSISSEQALCLTILALIFKNYDVFLCSLLLFASALGFLPRNFPKAKIFMGDCGALFLGFTLACLSSKLVLESQSIACMISTLLIFRIPILDTTQSFLRRLIARKNPFSADKGHFHHQLIKSGFTKECTTLLLLTLSLLFGFIGVTFSFLLKA
jgi:UDP-GlcNAc:undecaprenyl-phosphate GlcNAc-1-phosphate transferase